MRSIGENRSVAKVVGVLSLVSQLLAVLLYVILPALEVPYPTLYLFEAAWVIVLALTIWWLRDHPWRSAVLVLVGAVLVIVVRILGEKYLGFRG